MPDLLDEPGAGRKYVGPLAHGRCLVRRRESRDGEASENERGQKPQ
jgi:hypothetical protein